MTQTANIHKEIIERCKLGDRKSQYELYSLYARAMLNVSMRIVNNRAEAEDVLQECFIKAFSKIESFRGESSFGAWMKRIVVNHSLNVIKKKKHIFQELNEEIYQSPEEDAPEEEPEYTIEDIKNAMKQLADGYRIIFTLFMFEGQSHAEIAESLGITVVTSRSQLSRAKNRVKEIIQSTINN